MFNEWVEVRRIYLIRIRNETTDLHKWAMSPSLRQIILTIGQDVRDCHACYDCDILDTIEQDISLGSLVQMVLLNDEDVLSSHTLWSDAVLKSAPHVCKRGLNLEEIILALRQEAERRGLTVGK